jgi:selenocysteine lyase/cysteine desulfurase
MILSSQRQLFDMPREVCYLNAAYMTPLTRKQVAAGADALMLSSHPWNLGPEGFFDETEKTRALAAEVMGVTSDDVAFVPAASYGIATAAKNLPFRNGQAILLLEEQFPSNVYEWQARASRVGGEILTVATPDDGDWTTAVLETLQRFRHKIAIVSIANVYWSSGAKLDLVAISRECKAIGSALVLDLSQSLGAMPTDFAEIDPDFAVAAGYKWMMAPYGLSVLYVSPRWQHGVGLEQHWISRKGSEDFRALVNYSQEFQSGARRFDMGERSQLVLMPIFEEGLRQLLEWSVGNIADTLAALNARFAAVLEGAGFECVPANLRAPHILAARIGPRADEIGQLFRRHGISASFRGDMLRLSPHLWVDAEDEARFRDALGA